MVRSALVVLTFMSLPACTSDGEGTLAVMLSGEDAVREGFPLREEGETIEFADGWSVRFDRYLVAIADVTLAAGGRVGAQDQTVYVADLHRGDAELPEIGPLAARRWDSFSFSVRAPTSDDDVEAIAPATADDVAVLRDAGANLHIAGTATKGDRSVTFAWDLVNPSRNRDCTNGVDGTAGVVVRNNSTSDAEITFHVEHMFWDTLGSEQTRLRFDAIAAMADADGVVDFADLADQNLADLRDADGAPLLDEAGNPLAYDPGSAPVTDLRGFILAATRTEGHLGGAGLCTIESL